MNGKNTCKTNQQFYNVLPLDNSTFSEATSCARAHYNTIILFQQQLKTEYNKLFYQYKTSFSSETILLFNEQSVAAAIQFQFNQPALKGKRREITL